MKNLIVIFGRFPIYFWFLILYMISYIGSSLILHEFRYFKYVITFLFFFVFVLPTFQSIKFSNNYYKKLEFFWIFLGLILITGGAYFIVDSFESVQFIKDFSFITISIMFYFLLPVMWKQGQDSRVNYSYIFIRFSFITITIIFLFISAKNILLSPIQFDLFKFLIDSQSPFETTMAFPMGMFVIYFSYYNKKALFWTSLIFTLLSSKRIVILALVLIYVINRFTPSFRSINKQAVILIAVIINLLFVYLIIQFSLSKYDPFIEQYLGLSADYISMGRKSIYENLFAGNQGNWVKFFFGNGLGTSYVETTNFLDKEENLHSDVLKLFFDTGLLGLTIWIVFIYKLGFVNKIALLLTIYLNILYITDNVLIYYDTMIVYYLMIFFFHVRRTEIIQGYRRLSMTNQYEYEQK